MLIQRKLGFWYKVFFLQYLEIQWDLLESCEGHVISSLEFRLLCNCKMPYCVCLPPADITQPFRISFILNGTVDWSSLETTVIRVCTTSSTMIGRRYIIHNAFRSPHIYVDIGTLLTTRNSVLQSFLYLEVHIASSENSFLNTLYFNSGMCDNFTRNFQSHLMSGCTLLHLWMFP